MIDRFFERFFIPHVDRRFNRLADRRGRVDLRRLTNRLVDWLNPHEMSDFVEHATHRRVVRENDRLVHAVQTK